MTMINVTHILVTTLSVARVYLLFVMITMPVPSTRAMLILDVFLLFVNSMNPINATIIPAIQ
jgi:hypothetical protein